MMSNANIPHVPVLIVGAGQQGLAASYCLKEKGIDHVVLEKHRLGHAWANERWDSFCLVTPNWQCRLPGFAYDGDEPHGFMPREDIVRFLARYAAFVDPPLREGVSVERVARRPQGGFFVRTSAGAYTADAVIMAIGGYHTPFTPPLAAQLPADITQIHSLDYRDPAQMPDGAVLVVGSGQSGCQIAEDLHLAGRTVHLAIGDAPRSPRVYRGRDAIDWLDDAGYYDTPVDEHRLGKDVRANENHYMSGRDGGHEIDLRAFALQGMKLYGHVTGAQGRTLSFAPTLTQNLDFADEVYLRIQRTIDAFIDKAAVEAPRDPPYAPCWAPDADPAALDLDAANIRSVIWCTGFRADFSFIDVPAFDKRGFPEHERGASHAPGLYFLGLPWLYTWGSGRFRGVERDVRHAADHLEGYLREAAEPVLARASR